MNVEEICVEADHLPRAKQGELIGLLLEKFGAPEYDVSDAEVSRRIQETTCGKVLDLSHEELLAGLDHLRRS